MVDIIKNIIQLIIQFINGIYNIEIDLTPTLNVKLGFLIISFISFVIVIKIVLEAIGIKKGDDD